jgi:hypothetical protein
MKTQQENFIAEQGLIDDARKMALAVTNRLRRVPNADEERAFIKASTALAQGDWQRAMKLMQEIMGGGKTKKSLADWAGDVLVKAKELPVGTVRTWQNGKKMKKTADGWKPVGSGGANSKKAGPRDISKWWEATRLNEAAAKKLRRLAADVRDGTEGLSKKDAATVLAKVREATAANRAAHKYITRLESGERGTTEAVASRMLAEARRLHDGVVDLLSDLNTAPDMQEGDRGGNVGFAASLADWADGVDAIVKSQGSTASAELAGWADARMAKSQMYAEALICSKVRQAIKSALLYDDDSLGDNLDVLCDKVVDRVIMASMHDLKAELKTVMGKDGSAAIAVLVKQELPKCLREVEYDRSKRSTDSTSEYVPQPVW